MNKFEFKTVPSIVFSTGGTKQLGTFVQENCSCKKILIVTDSGLRNAGVMDDALVSLKAAGFDIEIYDKIVADPPEEVILDLAERAVAFGDLIIGFGGGSSMDAAKLAAVLATQEQPLKEMYGIGNVTASRKPLLLIPTTSGTGSEVTPISIVTTGETTKSGIVSSVLYADCAFLDAELTLGLPAPVTAATGIDAMVHAVEAYTSAHKKNPISDALALRALGLLSGSLYEACENGSNIDAREDTMLGAMLAGQAFANAPVAAVHALAYPLGGIYHLPHGLSNAVVLPHVLTFNLPNATQLYAELYRSLVPGNESVDDKTCAQGFVDFMTDLCQKTGVAKKLREFDIPQDALGRLAENAMQQTRLLVNNPREVAYEDALRIYEKAW